MPIYDYVCGSCHHRFEAFHGLNEAGPHQCPLCHETVRRAFAPPTILFKGTGWAKVDRRSSGTSGHRGGESSAKPSAPTPGTSPGSTSSAPAAPGPAAPSAAGAPPAPSKD